MLDKSRFEIAIEGNQATISYQQIGGRATIMTLAERVQSVDGYVSHQITETESEPRLQFVLSSPDINNCIDQAFVSMSA